MAVLSLFGDLGLSGLLSTIVGVVPVLNLASLITLFAGLLALIALREGRMTGAQPRRAHGAFPVREQDEGA